MRSWNQERSLKIHSNLKNKLMTAFKVRLREEPYLLINIIFTGVVLAILIYSGIFSPEKNNYPVVCYHEKLTGMQCASCGLSHSFSFIVRGNITGAYMANVYGMRIFLFFVLQMIMRVVFSILFVRNTNTGSQLITYDIAGSVILFLIAFYPFSLHLIQNLIQNAAFKPF